MMKKVNRVKALALSAMMAFSALSIPAWGADKVNAKSEGQVLNIYSWNEEFPALVADYYPGFVKNNPNDLLMGGKIGDVNVNFVIEDTQNNNYRENLMEKLAQNETASADNKVDIFAFEPDYAYDMVNSDYALPISDLGIVDDEIDKQFNYTKQICTSVDGELKGLTWQICPNVMIYNRNIAKEVLGSDLSEDVYNGAVQTWDKYYETSEDMASKGYKMNATYLDTFRLFQQTAKTPWVVNGDVNVDKVFKQWAELSKKQIENQHTGDGEIWGDDWYNGMLVPGSDGDGGSYGRVFCYTGPDWFIRFVLGDGEEGTIATNKGWGVALPTEATFWGGTFIAAATGTDNKTLVADIFRKLTTDSDIMMSMAVNDNEIVNNDAVLDNLASDDRFKYECLGNVNPMDTYRNAAYAIDIVNIPDPHNLADLYQECMRDYIMGDVDTYEEAYNHFYDIANERLNPPTTVTPTNPVTPPAPVTPSDQKSAVTPAAPTPASTPTPAVSNEPKAGDNIVVANVKYEIKNGAAAKYSAPVNKKIKKATIPATIQYEGKTYKVTEVSDSALKGCKKLTEVTISKNVEKIGKNALKGCGKVKTVNIKSTVLKSVGKNAFGGINKKAVFKVSKKNFKKINKMLNAKTGFKKTMKIKKN